MFFIACAEVAAAEELKLDLIRVDCSPDSLFEYRLIYQAGENTGVVGVYSLDEEWYYLYKQDTEKYRVKRRRELEGIAPSFTYKREKHEEHEEKQKNIYGEKKKVAELGNESKESINLIFGG